MEGDSVVNAAGILVLAAWCAVDSSDGRLRRIEIALSLAYLAGLALWLAGYDLRVGWRYLEESAFLVSAVVVAVTLVRWGRRELAEGEYDPPYRAP